MSTNDPFEIESDPFGPRQQRVRMSDLPINELRARLFSDFVAERSNIGRGAVTIAGLDGPMAERPFLLAMQDLEQVALATNGAYAALDSTRVPVLPNRLIPGAAREYRGVMAVRVTPPGGAVNAAFNWRLASPYTSINPSIGLNTGAIAAATDYAVDTGWLALDSLLGDTETPTMFTLEYLYSSNPAAGWTLNAHTFALYTRYTP